MTSLPVPVSQPTGIQVYLDKAVEILDNLGIVRKKAESSRLAEMLNEVSDLDEARVMAVARVLHQQDTFEQVVAEHVENMNYSDRYRTVGDSFNSIIEDSAELREHREDNKISLVERAEELWMKFRRGTVKDRFKEIRETYSDVTEDVREQVINERAIIEAYTQFKYALTEGVATAQELAGMQKERLRVSNALFAEAAKDLDEYKEEDEAQKTRLRLQRDQAEDLAKREDSRYQLLRSLADNMATSLAMGEGLKTSLEQTNKVKSDGYMQLLTFYNANRSAFALMSAELTGIEGLHELTETTEAFKEGTKRTLEHLRTFGHDLKERAAKTAYGPMVAAEDIGAFLDATVELQRTLYKIADEGRQLSEENARKTLVYHDQAIAKRADIAREYASRAA